MEIEGLSLDNILDSPNGDSLHLFEDPSNASDEKEDEETNTDKPDKSDEDTGNKSDTGDINKTTTEVDVDKLFSVPEKVGSEEKDKKDKEDTADAKDNSISSNNDFFSSIADALADEGIFPNFDSDKIKEVKSAEDLRNLINDSIKSELTDKQKRIDEALSNNVEPDVIRQYEGTLDYLDSIDEDKLSAEGKENEDTRKRIIFQDLINRGFTQERAAKSVQRSIDDGTDIDDAKDALKSNKEFFKSKYDTLLSEAKAKSEEGLNKAKLEVESLKNTIYDDKNSIFDGLTIDKQTREKIFDNISKPVYKDPETGYMYTAIQKYDKDNHKDFMSKLGTIFTLTDGFKNLDNLTKGKVNKEIKRGFSKLESRINNTSRNSNGNLKFASGNEDKESIWDKGLRLDI